MGIEFQILDALQKIHTPILDKFMAAITSLGNAGIIWIILAAVLLIYPKTRKTGIIVAAALIVDLILCNVILKNLIARTRPYDINTAVQIIIAKPHDYSFPSGHTAASFASVAALYLAGAKKGWKIAGVLAVLIAFSRLYFAFLIVTPLAVPQMAIREKYLQFGSISADILLSTNVISE